MFLAAFTILCLFALQVVALGYTSNGMQVGDTFGVDVSQPVSVASFECMKSLGNQFVIVRAYRSIGQPDSNAPQTIANARSAGIPYVDVYMFPCPTCSKSAGEQVREMVDNLSGSEYRQIWLDVEGTQYWKDDQTENRVFFEGLLTEAVLHKTTGVYTKSSDWNAIMGSGYTGGAAHQLWWPRYDQNPSFSGFSPFGGWARPAIKQYEGDSSLCDAVVDKNWCDSQPSSTKCEQFNLLLLVLCVVMVTSY